ncbi:NAD(P)-binding protein [Glonium stellatum]|uniref:NAD(P)-binding protein n=1 Tax=Glonium stellatum TaxID=574774 RepID=A0A8E2JWA6_9PEZI|nr:NAD(P)-binding protein [Glonium stellatum]
MAPSVLLIGAGGAFGQPLTEEFIRKRSKFDRIAILAATEEKTSKFKYAQEDGVEIVIGSFLDPNVYKGFSHVISTVGNSIMRLQPGMIEAAIIGGVQHFYPSEWNSDISQKAIYGLRYFRDKQVTRDHLVAKAKGVPGFRYTIFITGIFTEWSVLEFYGFDHKKHTVKVYGKPDARVGLTSIPDIARYTVDSLLIPFEATGRDGAERVIRVGGEITTFQRVVDLLGEARDVKYSVTYVDPSEAITKEEEARLNGDEEAQMAWSIVPLISSGFGVPDGIPGSKLDNDRFSFIPEKVHETFQRVYKH